jgi:hypothetical protein
MNAHELRRYQMLQRVRRFAHRFRDAFADVPLAGQMFAVVDECAEAADGEATRHFGAVHHARTCTIVKADARKAVLQQLRALRRTARALAIDAKGLDERFRLPREPRDLLLAAFARGVVEHARPLEQAFLDHAMPATFLADLAQAIVDFEAAIGRRESATGAHISARVGIEHTVARGFAAVRRLDVIVANRFRLDASALAAWRCARRIERSPLLPVRRLVPAVSVPERQPIAAAQQRRSMADEARQKPHEIPTGMRAHFAA